MYRIKYYLCVIIFCIEKVVLGKSGYMAQEKGAGYAPSFDPIP